LVYEKGLCRVNKSRIEEMIERRIAARRSEAAEKAGRALRELAARGIRAWIVGSLAKGTFSLSADVDFLVECDAAFDSEAFRIVEAILGEFPFHVLPYRRVREDVRLAMMEDAVDAPGIRARPPEAR
jgi:predicted nucleotidyltransferase